MSFVRSIGHVVGVCVSALLLSFAPQASLGQSLYASWPNGPPTDANFFPIGVWYQSPNTTGRSGPYPTQAQAAVAEGINIFIGLGSSVAGVDTWPEAFGVDAGELEAIQANNLYAIGGIYTPYTQNASSNSVASMLALAGAIGATSNLIGYNVGDEPACGGTMELVPTVVQNVQSYDSTRVIFDNQTHWMMSPQWNHCLNASIAALQATSVGSMDLYPITNAYLAGTGRVTGSDFLSVPNDSLFQQGLATQALRHFAASNQPLWVFVESGSDSLGAAEANNSFKGSVRVGSNLLKNASGFSKFTARWVGLSVSGGGIPAGTSIVKIVDSTHALMSATASATGTNEAIKVAGGTYNSDCYESANICVVNGNEFRATPMEVNAEAWMSIINGANGIEYFCHDSTTSAFCLGDNRGGAAAATTQANLSYINKTILTYAPVLNSPTVGICSMQQEDYVTGAVSTTTSCSDGVLTMVTPDSAVPGMALVKQLNGTTYLFAQSDRRSPYGAVFTFTLNGLSGQTATVVYDSNANYDSANSTIGLSASLDATGRFSDALGADGDSYEVKIYAIK